MPEPISICLEDLGEGRFTRCVAVSGGGPGLRLGLDGAIRWLEAGPDAGELWVSADERLILRRPLGAPPVVLSRGDRTLDVPFAKPVVVLDGDEVELAGRRFRLHVHGLATRVAPPERLALEAPSGRLAGAAAAVALGAALVGCPTPPDPAKPGAPAPQKPIEVRDRPPEMAAPDEPPPPREGPKPIEVRERPPEPMPPQPDPPPPPVKGPPAPDGPLPGGK